MAKLTNEYIQARIAGNEKVEKAFIDANGDAVIFAADGFGWEWYDADPATVDIIDAGRGAKHFNLSLDLIVPIAPAAPIDFAPVDELTEVEQAEYQADCAGDAEHERKTYEDAADDNA